jgi:hypothetical protein
MASKMSMSSRFSVNAASGVAPSPPAPKSCPNIDFNGNRQRVDSTRSRQHSPPPLPQVLEGDDTMEENKQNKDSDVQKEMDDDGHRPLRDMSKRSAVMKDRTIPMDSKLSSPATKASLILGPLNLTQQPSPLLHFFGVFVQFVVCCGKRVCIPHPVEIIIDGVYTRTWCSARRDRRCQACVACTPA